MLERFFAANRQTIADDGFSRRVTRRLPKGAMWLNRLWSGLCLTAIVAMFLTRDGLKRLALPVETLRLKIGIWLETVPELSLKDFYQGYVMVAVALAFIFIYTISMERR